MASLTGSAVGMFQWLDIHSVEDPLLLVVMNSLLYFLPLVLVFGTVAVCGLIFHGIVQIGCVIAYWKTERKWILLILSIPVFICSMFAVNAWDIMGHWV